LYILTAEKDVFYILFQLCFSICRWYLSAVDKKLSRSLSLERLRVCVEMHTGISDMYWEGIAKVMFVNVMTQQ